MLVSTSCFYNDANLFNLRKSGLRNVLKSKWFGKIFSSFDFLLNSDKPDMDSGNKDNIYDYFIVIFSWRYGYFETNKMRKLFHVNLLWNRNILLYVLVCALPIWINPFYILVLIYINLFIAWYKDGIFIIIILYSRFHYTSTDYLTKHACKVF